MLTLHDVRRTNPVPKEGGPDLEVPKVSSVTY